MKRNSTKQKRNPVFLGQIRDRDGGFWDVRDIRATKHGFDLFFGSPPTRLDGHRGGRPHLIPTQALFDYWNARRTHGEGTIHDLPASSSTLITMRRRLGFHYFDDRSEFWQQHREELANLSAGECSTRHGVDISEIYTMRRRLLGRKREPHWWLQPEADAILRSDISLNQAAKKLGITKSWVAKMRKRLGIVRESFKPEFRF